VNTVTTFNAITGQMIEMS